MRFKGALPIFTAIVLLSVSLSLYVHSTSPTPTPPLSVYNGEWNGLTRALSVIKGMRSTEILISSPLALERERDPRNTLYMAVGPERPYTGPEIKALQDFIKRGGRAVILDDRGVVNPFIENFGIRITGYPVYDQYYLKSPPFLLMEVNVRAFSGVVLTDMPTTVESRYALVWAHTSEEGWIDFNMNGILDPEASPLEVKGSYPLVVEYNPFFTENSSVGNIIVISDSSIFMNDLLPRANNTAFLKTLVQYMLPRGGKVIVDESVHRPPSAHSSLLRGLLRALLYLQITGVSWSLSILVLLLLPLLYMRYQPHPERRRARYSPRLHLLSEEFLTERDRQLLKRMAVEVLKRRMGLEGEALEKYVKRLPEDYLPLKKILRGERMSEEEVNRCLIILSRL